MLRARVLYQPPMTSFRRGPWSLLSCGSTYSIHLQFQRLLELVFQVKTVELSGEPILRRPNCFSKSKLWSWLGQLDLLCPPPNKQVSDLFQGVASLQVAQRKRRRRRRRRADPSLPYKSLHLQVRMSNEESASMVAALSSSRRPIPKRGQIKCRIATAAIHSVVSTLWRAIDRCRILIGHPP
ncbi:hypothetical protein GW17_00035108 [Ensete ventricosum]|nr:hypothetical protein GW17_00035108 [Ensete ventricosum]